MVMVKNDTEILTKNNIDDAYQNHYPKEDCYQDVCQILHISDFFPKKI